MSLAPSPFVTGTAPPEPLILVEEISHRVVNEYTQAIASLALAAAGTADKTARSALKDTERRLREYAAAHRALQPPLAATYELGEYLQKICSAISTASLHERGVRLMLIHDNEVSLSADHCWRFGLILSELITNSVRHGFSAGPGAIVVELIVDREELVCRVSDNGCAEPDVARGRGRRLVDRLAEGMGGRVDWLFSSRGSRVAVAIPRFAAPETANQGALF